MVYTVALVVCWVVGAYGVIRLNALQLRMTLGRTVFPVSGMRMASARVAARLADLPGESGHYRALVWARTGDGRVVCRAEDRWLTVIADCRQQGDQIVVDAVLPHGVILFYAGLFGFLLTAATIMSGEVTAGAWMLIPAGLLLGVAVQGTLHLRRARAVARLLPRYLEAVCAEARST